MSVTYFSLIINMHIMEKEKNIEEKIFKFRGNKLKAVPELSPRCCMGCDLLDKGCYRNVDLLKICRKGYIFKKIEK